MTSKQRTELKSQAMKLDSIFQIGKSSLTPQSIEAIRAALKARELIKINVLKNCDDDTNALAKLIAERTGAEVVQVIGNGLLVARALFAGLGEQLAVALKPSCPDAY